MPKLLHSQLHLVRKHCMVLSLNDNSVTEPCNVYELNVVESGVTSAQLIAGNFNVYVEDFSKHSISFPKGNAAHQLV